MKHHHSFWYQLGGYYAIPHELLHVLAYRLIGKSCEYQWGNYYVKPLSETTQREKLFVLLLPFAVCWFFGILFHLLWIGSAFFIQMPPERYFIDGPTWHFIFPNIASLFILYSGNSYGDVFRAYRLLFGKDESQNNGPKPHHPKAVLKAEYLQSETNQIAAQRPPTGQQ